MVGFDLNFIRYVPSKMNRITFIDIDCQFVSIEPMSHYFHIFADTRLSSTTCLITVVSSANIVKELSVQALSRSLMYSRKKGPSTDPFGAPHKTSLLLFGRVNVFYWSVEKVSNKLKMFPLKPLVPVCVKN